MKSANNLRDSGHIVILNTTQDLTPVVSDISCLRILERIQKMTQNISDRMVTYSINLHDAELLITGGKSSEDEVSEYCNLPHSTGTLVSTDMTISMVSAAHGSPETFRAILKLMGGDSSDTRFCLLRTKTVASAKELFFALLAKERLMIAISKVSQESTG